MKSNLAIALLASAAQAQQDYRYEYDLVPEPHHYREYDGYSSYEERNRLYEQHAP